jgi:hypothetical protein
MELPLTGAMSVTAEGDEAWTDCVDSKSASLPASLSDTLRNPGASIHDD